MEIGRVVDWLKLEKDIIELIATRLTVLVDFIRFGAVCKTWHSIFLENRHLLPHLLPVLMLPSEDGEKSEFQSFFSLSEKQIYTLKMLTNTDNDKWCRGSSEGYLIMVDLHLNISLLNPFSRTEMPLPCFTTLPHIISVRETDTGTILYTYQFPFPGRPPLVETAEHMREHDYVHKVIMAGPYIVAILAFRSVLAFCRMDGGTWTYVESDWFLFEDVVFYNGKIYAISEFGRVGVLDLSEPHPTLMVIAMIVDEDVQYCKKYLVESSGQLLMVARKFDLISFEDPDHGNTSFEIFRVDVSKHMFVPLKALGDGMLFLGENCLMSLSARNFSGCEGNRIYFTDDQEWYTMESCRGCDLRVYNVEDGSIEPHYKMDSKWLWPWPIWLTPKPW